MEEVVALGRRMLEQANLPAPVAAACAAALGKRGRLFSDSPMCARLFLGCVDLVAPGRRAALLPAVVAGDCMIAGYDLLDHVYDQDDPHQTRARLVPAGITLLSLAQEFLDRTDAPAERRMLAARIFAHGGRRAFAGHLRDYTQRGGSPADVSALIWVIRQRSGSLVAAACSAAVAVSGGTRRQIGLAAAFGRAFATVAQLEDDLGDRHLDAQAGRQTIPTFLAARASDQVVEATTWVLMRRAILEAASALHRMEATHPAGSSDRLWRILPPDLRPQPARTGNLLQPV